MVPTFIGREIAIKAFEMGCGLRLLWRCQPDHPLCDVFDIAKNTKERLELKWLLSWDEIHETHDRLDEYAKNISQFLDRDANPTFVSTVVIPSLQKYIDNPSSIGSILSDMEKQKQSIYNS